MIPVLSVAALLAAVWSGGSVAAPTSHQTAPTRALPLTGTWSGRYSGAFSGHFTLKWRQNVSKLSGTIKLSNPAGTYPIGGGVHGHKITFGAVGVGATYTGSVSGKSMSGHYNSPQGGGSWSARKVSGKVS